MQQNLAVICCRDDPLILMAFIRASSGILEASAAKKLFQEKLPGFIADVTRCTAGSNTHLLDTHGCSYGSLAHADAHKDDVGQARTHRS